MKTKPRLLLCVLLVALSLIGQTTPVLADKRVALVIGNGAYKSTARLTNPPNDATDVSEALRAIGFDVTLKIDVDKRQMDQAVAQFAREGRSADAVLFYYAGHGMQFEGKNFLMPVDAELQDELSLRYEMAALEDVKAAMQLSRGVKIMVLDACRNNPLAESFGRSIAGSTRDVTRVRGFAPAENAQGMIVVYATQADRVADDGDGRNSPFSQAFLKEVKEPGLEVGTMFRRIGVDVYSMTDGQQSPELSISMVPEYYLNQSETDRTVWAQIRTKADASTLREFLNRYPDSFYAPDARALLDLLEREAREKANDDRAKSERAVAQASTQEQDLAAKLAAAEAEREKLTKELTQQADNRAEALKAEIAQLQQQAAQAKATAEAAVQKAEDAKKAAEGSAEVASAAPAPPPSAAGDLSLDQRALVAPIEAELRRVGCYAGGDDDWGAPSVRLGVAEFGRYAKLIPPTLPDDGLLSALKGQSDRVCPLECSARETAVNGQCVAKVCPRGEILGRNGQCFEPVARAPPAAATRQVEYPRPAANREPRAVAARKAGRPASHGGSASRCFTFNNNQYCE